MTRFELISQVQSELIKTLKAVTGADVEIIIAKSIKRGSFLSVLGMADDCDKVRAILNQCDAYTFSERDADPEYTEVMDFYSAA